MLIVYCLIPAALLVASVVACVLMVARGTPRRRAMAIHLLSLIVIAAATMFVPLTASADTPADDAQTEQVAASDSGLKYIGAALAVGLAGIGGGIAGRDRRERGGPEVLR